MRRPRAKKKYLRWKLQVRDCSSNFWCVETWSKEGSCSSTVKQAQNMLKTSEVVVKEGWAMNPVKEKLKTTKVGVKKCSARSW